MGIGPIPGIRGLGPSTTPIIEREIEPPFALDRPGRMGDDAYKGSSESAERGMEEEESEPSESTTDDAATETSHDEAKSAVNFFA